MSLTNSPDPALREAVVQQDLKSVLHPIVQHKVLESKQIVVAGAAGDGVIDGTTKDEIVVVVAGERAVVVRSTSTKVRGSSRSLRLRRHRTLCRRRTPKH